LHEHNLDLERRCGGEVGAFIAPVPHNAFVLTRRAEPKDAPAIEALYRELIPGNPDIRVDPARIAEVAAAANDRLLVVEADDEVSATAFLTICLDPMFGFQSYGVVENFVVSAARRGQGLGRALMDAIEAEARHAESTKLMLLSSVSRTGAHQFFTRLGFDGEKKRGFVKYLNRRSG
jgi:N-acetylglutamate synthase-like GNAT family acetyltransferase